MARMDRFNRFMAHIVELEIQYPPDDLHPAIYDRDQRNPHDELIPRHHQFHMGGQRKPGLVRFDLWVRHHESRKRDHRRSTEFSERVDDDPRNGNRWLWRPCLCACKLNPPPVPLRGRRPLWAGLALSSHVELMVTEDPFVVRVPLVPIELFAQKFYDSFCHRIRFKRKS